LTQVGLPLLGVPGLTVTTGMAGDRPVGVQLVGPRYREDVLLTAGEAITGPAASIAAINPAWA
jgi:amidase